MNGLIVAETPQNEPLPSDLPQNETVPCDIVEAPRTLDPREALDEAKRATIVAIIRLGGTRRAAALEVGCAPRTIARTAVRDPHFAAELAAAESRLETKALRLIDRATDQEKYWRAAAWVLERRNPEEFGVRAARTLRRNQVLQFFDRFLHAVLPHLPAECRELLLEEYDNVFAKIMGEAERKADKSQFKFPAPPEPAPGPPPPPKPPLLEEQCPRDEAAARSWLQSLTLAQIDEMLDRTLEKPKTPEWAWWAKLLGEAGDRKERQEREARRAARDQKARELP